jgi:hypothetical protein
LVLGDADMHLSPSLQPLGRWGCGLVGLVGGEHPGYFGGSSVHLEVKF